MSNVSGIHARPAAVSGERDDVVLFVAPDPATHGGIQSYARSMMEELGGGVELFAVSQPGFRGGPPARIQRLVAELFRFERRLAGGGIALVHINTSLRFRTVVREGLLVLLASRRGKRTVVTFHGWSPPFERLIRRWFRGLFRSVFSPCDAVIVLAQDFCAALRDIGLRNRIIVETTFVDPVARPSLSSHERNAGPLTVLFLSRVIREKGIDITWEAFRAVAGRFPEWRLVIAGDGPDLQRVRDCVREAGVERVEFAGYVNGAAKNRLFATSDIFILPTIYGEGMPISVLEAMSWGLPVITRPVGGLKDFFEDGVMGCLTERVDAAGFAQLLERLMQNPEMRSRMGEFNRRYAEERFTREAAAGRLRQVYEAIRRSTHDTGHIR